MSLVYALVPRVDGASLNVINIPKIKTHCSEQLNAFKELDIYKLNLVTSAISYTNFQSFST